MTNEEAAKILGDPHHWPTTEYDYPEFQAQWDEARQKGFEALITVDRLQAERDRANELLEAIDSADSQVEVDSALSEIALHLQSF